MTQHDKGLLSYIDSLRECVVGADWYLECIVTVDESGTLTVHGIRGHDADDGPVHMWMPIDVITIDPTMSLDKAKKLAVDYFCGVYDNMVLWALPEESVGYDTGRGA